MTEGVLVEPALPSFLFLPPDVCLHDGDELVQRANLGPALGALNDAVPDCRAMDREGAGAALTTLQQVLVFAPRHRSSGEPSPKDRAQPIDTSGESARCSADGSGASFAPR